MLLILYVQPVVELSYPDGCSVKSEKKRQNLAETFLLWTSSVTTLIMGLESRASCNDPTFQNSKRFMCVTLWFLLPIIGISGKSLYESKSRLDIIDSISG